MKVYNYLTRKKEEFVPQEDKFVRMYVCGPTVYEYSHIGHAKCYISFDVIVRYLRWRGYTVKYVQNLTDVGHMFGDVDIGEDKIIWQAKKEQLHPMEIAEKYIRAYFEDMDRLNVLRPDISPRPTAHIPEIIEAIKILLKKGYAYEVNGSVYFEVAKFKDYGKLSGRTLDELKAGARIAPHPDKRSPFDFALWIKAPKGHILRWPSPWGDGYPGWHIECSVMSMKYLGPTLDIHGGGIDNIFPHNECEIAQSEALTGKQFVRYWLLNGTVFVEGEKMSKSKGNFVRIRDALQKFQPKVLRYFILLSHYRSPTDYSEDAIKDAEKGLQKFTETLFFAKVKKEEAENNIFSTEMEEKLKKFKEKFVEVMDDDFNTPRAIAVLHDALSEFNNYLKENPSKSTIEYFENWIKDLGENVLGILPELPKEELSAKEFIDLLIDVRRILRQKREYELADFIREELRKRGIDVYDLKDRTIWKYASNKLR